jgi:hypothetical protein
MIFFGANNPNSTYFEPRLRSTTGCSRQTPPRTHAHQPTNRRLDRIRSQTQGHPRGPILCLRPRHERAAGYIRTVCQLDAAQLPDTPPAAAASCRRRLLPPPPPFPTTTVVTRLFSFPLARPSVFPAAEDPPNDNDNGTAGDRLVSAWTRRRRRRCGSVGPVASRPFPRSFARCLAPGGPLGMFFFGRSGLTGWCQLRGVLAKRIRHVTRASFAPGSIGGGWRLSTSWACSFSKVRVGWCQRFVFLAISRASSCVTRRLAPGDELGAHTTSSVINFSHSHFFRRPNRRAAGAGAGCVCGVGTTIAALRTNERAILNPGQQGKPSPGELNRAAERSGGGRQGPSG